MNRQKQNMQYQTISVQELRTKMPEISRNLECGMRYILIRKSKPIAEIHPYLKNQKSRRDALDIFINPPKSMLIHTKKSAAQIIREERD